MSNGATLYWDASGANPALFNVRRGSGNWDTTTSANWSNGTVDSVWTNGDFVDLSQGTSPVPPNSVITIDDPSGSVNAAQIIFISASNPSLYTIAAIPGDTLSTGMGNINIQHTGTISAPITGTGGIGTNGGGTLTLTGHSTYTGFTDIADNTVLLANGASLGNTQIFGYQFLTQGTTTAGFGGAGTAGATIGVYQDDGLSLFSMFDGTAGTFTLRQESGFVGTALGLRGGTFGFDLTNSAADELLVSGPGKAAFLNSNINSINISTGSDLYLTPGNYTLISVPSGGLTGTFDFPNGLTTESVSVGGASYTLQLTNFDTSEVLTVLPEPSGVLLLLCGLLLGRRRYRT
jgi:fibronectin-binding autotransporter adhesin